MPTLVIVGFQYDKSVKELPSMVTDVYLVYSYFRDLGARIYIASDAKTVTQAPNTTEYIVSKIVDEGYLNFVERGFMRHKHHVTSISELETFFQSVELTEDRRLIIYYTGHGRPNGIFLPNGSTILAGDFRSLILGVGNFEATELTGGKYSIKKGINSLGSQILIIMDCCNPHGLYLPYNIAKSGPEKNGSNLFICPNIIMLAPCESGQPTTANDSVSPFTKKLITHLKDPIKLVDLATIISSTSSETESVAYASYPNSIVLWPWTFTRSIDCQINERLDAIVLTRNNK